LFKKSAGFGFNRIGSIIVAVWITNSRFWGAFGRRFRAIGRIMR
jgi:hypothetical protein